MGWAKKGRERGKRRGGREREGGAKALNEKRKEREECAKRIKVKG